MMLSPDILARSRSVVRQSCRPIVHGRVTRVTGLLVEASVPACSIGDVVAVDRNQDVVLGEVVGFRGETALIIPFHDMHQVAPGARIMRRGDGSGMPVSNGLLGRIIDPFGRPLDGGPEIDVSDSYPMDAPAPPPAVRLPIRERFDTSIKVVDGLLTCGRGQRVGIFAGAGVGKTILMRQIARQARADVAVIGLIGERGCEVQDLLADFEIQHSVLVVATSDRSPMERARGALGAISVAEYFRDQGANVLLIIDSLTRYAMALREIGLAAGEPAATKGYPPSVFATLPRLLERVCPLRAGGSITGFFTVLVEGDDMSDPVADSARSLLDAHIVLSRDLAGRGHFPAIDVLASASRVARQVTDKRAQTAAQKARNWMSLRKEAEELKSVGAYIGGQNPEYDAAMASAAAFDGWARQAPEEPVASAETLTMLESVIATADKTATDMANRMRKDRSVKAQ